MNIEWVGSPNFSSREGRKPIVIVDHITQGLMPGCLNWLQNPASQASAHYIVTRDGRILQLVKDEDKAWHAGKVNTPSWPLYDGTNPNLYTIGIEHEGMTGEPLTEPQYQATLYLHKFLMSKWSIPADTNHIIGHYRIDSVTKANCPGSAFPWDRLFKDLQAPAIMAQPGTPAPIPLNFSYPNNAQVVGDDLYIRDANGVQIPGRYVSNGDRITVLDVSYSKQLALVEYPTPSGVRSGYVKNVPSLIHYYNAEQWHNGSTIENVLDENGSKVGSLNSRETATPLYRKNGRLHVVYDTDKGQNTKSGYVVYNGGFTKF